MADGVLKRLHQILRRLLGLVRPGVYRSRRLALAGILAASGALLTLRWCLLTLSPAVALVPALPAVALYLTLALGIGTYLALDPDITPPGRSLPLALAPLVFLTFGRRAPDLLRWLSHRRRGHWLLWHYPFAPLCGEISRRRWLLILAAANHRGRWPIQDERSRRILRTLLEQYTAPFEDRDPEELEY